VLGINEELEIASHFEFACSPYSDPQNFQVEIGQLDLKNQDDLRKINATYDMVFSAHCKQIFPKELVDNHECFNLHPGYNPINRGWYPQVFAIIYDYLIGATLHKIDLKLDHGDIIDRVFVEKKESDTSFSLYSRVVEAELELWTSNIVSILEQSYSLVKPEGEGNMFLKKDFNGLLELDLNSEGTLKEHITLLRALTFDGYRNAYFVAENGQKVFVEIKLEEE
jgi:methionyl-tRNA formyltransferase